MVGSPFEKANLVFIPYCSSDAHMGQTEALINVTGDGKQVVYFHGRSLAVRTVQTLIGLKENQSLIFGGLSAGGRGSMVTIDFLTGNFTPNLFGISFF